MFFHLFSHTRLYLIAVEGLEAHRQANGIIWNFCCVCRLSANLYRMPLDSYHLIENDARSDATRFFSFITLQNVELPVIFPWPSSINLLVKQSVCKWDTFFFAFYFHSRKNVLFIRCRDQENGFQKWLFHPLFSAPSSVSTAASVKCGFLSSLVRSIDRSMFPKNLNTGCFFTVIRRVNSLKRSALPPKTHESSGRIAFILQLLSRWTVSCFSVNADRRRRSVAKCDDHDLVVSWC